MEPWRFRRQGDARSLGAILSAVAWLLVGACGTSSSAPSSTCAVTVGQIDTTLAAEGASGSIAVTAASGCTWTAVSSASFISITQGASSTGNGTVQFVVVPNTGAERTGTVTISGTTLTFTQRAFIPPTLAAPVLTSPVGGNVVSSLRPTLVVTNAVATGNVGTVTYRFEVSIFDSFPSASRNTVAQGGIAQATGGSTSWQVASDLLRDSVYFWRAQATNGTITSEWSTILTFQTPR